MSEKYCLVIDSGIGGLTTLSEIERHIPGLNFIYFADRAHMPYGSKTSEEVINRVLCIVREVKTKYEINSIVIACNTASSVAGAILREKEKVPVICIEPAIIPASNKFKNILVLATELTLKEDKFLRLISNISGEFQLVSIKSLAKLIEKLKYDNAPLENVILTQIKSTLMLYKNCDAIVLGCTHYCFIKDMIASLTRIPIFDGNEGLARHLSELITGHDISLSPKQIFVSDSINSVDNNIKKIYNSLKKR